MRNILLTLILMLLPTSLMATDFGFDAVIEDVKASYETQFDAITVPNSEFLPQICYDINGNIVPCNTTTQTVTVTAPVVSSITAYEVTQETKTYAMNQYGVMQEVCPICGGVKQSNVFGKQVSGYGINNRRSRPLGWRFRPLLRLINGW